VGCRAGFSFKVGIHKRAKDFGPRSGKCTKRKRKSQSVFGVRSSKKKKKSSKLLCKERKEEKRKEKGIGNWQHQTSIQKGGVEEKKGSYKQERKKGRHPGLGGCVMQFASRRTREAKTMAA